ncbi:MAG: hypothetical protein QOK04_321, partial [Solirubrobacteraceae bacterium]|nr:hypothetical protein [Solirubrobacteraceae bacterium]
MPPRRRLIAAALICALATALAAGCGQGSSGGGGKPVLARKGDQSQAARSLGFPGFATKNTTRVGGADATADAAAVSLAVYSGALPAARPPAVALVGDGDWQAGIAASVLMSNPTRAPILMSSADSLPAASRDALSALKPLGSKQTDGAQLIRVGSVASPAGLKTTA